MMMLSVSGIASGASSRYFAEWKGRTIVVCADQLLTGARKEQAAVLYDLRTLIQNDIRVVLVYGEGARMLKEMIRRGGARRHPETNKLVAPDEWLPGLLELRQETGRQLLEVGKNIGLDCELLPADVVHCEYRVGHQGTGSIRDILTERIGQVLDRKRLAIIGFGGLTSDGVFLYVPA
ncbi:MAG: hypothetical protein KDA99_12655, partial [Planctomycetales bacterium]|nr:hypothetical protein [Planctomycetales bacterium]